MKKIIAFLILSSLGLTGCSTGKSHLRKMPKNGDSVVRTASRQLGKPYKSGGITPEEGFDCSGLTWWVYHQHGIQLPRSSQSQFHAGRKVRRKRLSLGDLVFFNTEGKGPSHVGIYSGNDHFIHAPNHGQSVRKDSLSNRYWKKRYRGARRVL